jgi:MoaA/NifB/PqqE/SkfB family radical SAM enzyme
VEFIRADKIYHHPDRLIAYKEGGIVYPITVEIHLTNRCNIKCGYCVFNDRHNNLEMSYSEALSVIDRLYNMHVKAIGFSGGGEPTVYKDLLDIVLYTKSMGMDVGLITNGVEFDVRLLDYLTWVRFSLDASDASMYTKIKGVNKYFRVVKNIRDAIAYKRNMNLPVTIGIHTVVTEDNVNHIYDIAKIADTLGADYFQYRPLERGNTLEKPEIPRNLSISIMDTDYKWKEGKDTTPYTSCLGADFIGAIGVDLNYYMCSVHTYDKTASYGNILEDNIIVNRGRVQREFDYSRCPAGCRGAIINKCLVEYNKLEHINFL